MSAAPLMLHPNVVIAHHGGHLLAARLSCSAPPTPINAHDLTLLSLFTTPATVDDAVKRFTGPEFAAFLPGRPDPGLVRQRLRQLGGNQVLVEARSGAGSTDSGDLIHPGDVSGEPATGEQRFRLGRNFALLPRPEGFEVVATAPGRTHLLDLEAAQLLGAFTHGKTIAEVAAAHRPRRETAEVAAFAGWLAAERLLLPVAGQALAAGDYRREVPLRRASAPGWRETEADGRIPVYFVPHMENHFPLALGMIYSALANWRDGALNERFQLVPIVHLDPQAFIDGPYRKFGPGIWLFSNYMWSLPLNLKLSAAIKQHDARNLTIHGGPSTPSHHGASTAFLERNPSVDIAVHGEGEITACEILETVQRDDAGAIRPSTELAGVNGLTWRGAGDGPVRTAERERMREPDRIPSPYLAGAFDAYEARVEAAIIETNRGCPFKCTFCDWGSATQSRVNRFDMQRIHDELEWIGRNRIGVLWIADANFGMLKRDLEIARWIVDVRNRHGYPREVVVNYTKNANALLAEIIKVFTAGGIISQGIISIQTSDPDTLAIIERENIKTAKYDELIDIFSDLGLPMSTDLMIGLPGMTPEAFDRDLQRYIDADVSVKAYPTQLLPNSPMAHPDYVRRHRIEVDANGFLTACASYTPRQLQAMHRIYHVYTVGDGYGTLRHVLRFLQWEHGIRAMDFLHRLADASDADPERFPAISWVLRLFSTEKCMPGGWRRFYDEVAAFLAESYGIERDSALDTVLAVNEAVMPDDARSYPLTLPLAHDYVGYFGDHHRNRSGALRPLRSYPPGTLEVADPNRMAQIDFEYQQYDTHQFFWELHAPVSRPKSVAREA